MEAALPVVSFKDPRDIYTPLKEDEIRFVDLLPGLPEDDIHLNMLRSSLPTVSPSNVPVRRLSKRALQKTCPPGWDVSETPEGRYLFSNDDVSDIQYIHPLSEVEAALYAPLSNDTYSTPTYEALSYVWGPEEKPAVVHVSASLSLDGCTQTCETCLPIGRNLEAALRAIRHASRRRRLWIDALCINQNDVGERSKQVLLMSRIYSQAWRVLVWLGPASNDSFLAIEAIRSLGGLVDVSKDGWRFPTPGSKYPDLYRKDVPLPLSKAQWKSLQVFFQRDWFKRLWCTQEIVLANPMAILQCGPSDTVELYLVRRALSCFLKRTDCPLATIADTPISLCINNYGRGSTGVFAILLCQWKQQCSNPRDRIYGNMSIISERVVQGIVPSYSATTEEVYRHAFLKICEATERLHLLALCQRPESWESSNYPSWVPNWQRKRPDSLPRGIALYRATGVSKASFRHVLEVPRRLSALGLLFCSVTRVNDPFPMLDLTPSQVLRKMSQSTPRDAIYPSGEPTLDAFVRLLYLDDFLERHPGWLSPSFDICKQEVARVLTALEDNQSSEPLSPQLSHQVARNSEDGLPLFHTDNGYFGYGPSNMKVDDIVCFFLGCWMPIILRPVHSESEQYSFVGCAYVQGLMDNEAILGQLPSNWSLQLVDVDGCPMPRYLNSETEQLSVDDPRLPPLSSNWIRTEQQLTPDDYPYADYFRNTVTGDIMNSDPRLLPESLREMRTALKEFDLV